MPFKDGKHPGGNGVHMPTGAGSRQKARAAALRKLEAEARERIISGAVIALDAELVAQIVEKIPTGNYPSVIAESLGVPPGTFAVWMQKGKRLWETRDSPETEFTTAADPEGLRVQLYLCVSRAEASWEYGQVETMAEKIRDGSYWQGEMTMLQRRKPARWDARGRDTHDGSQTIEEQLAAYQRELEGASADE